MDSAEPEKIWEFDKDIFDDREFEEVPDEYKAFFTKEQWNAPKIK